MIDEKVRHQKLWDMAGKTHKCSAGARCQNQVEPGATADISDDSS